MKIVMFSINPLYPDRVMGGAPKQLQKVAEHLGGLGHEVVILCTAHADSHTPFEWAGGVQVRPQLRFKQPFPQPYDTPAYHIANAIQDVAEALEGADRFYMHDGELLFPPVYRQVPTVVSLRDNVYPETMLGGFLFQGDTLIAISNYARDYYVHTMGRFFPEFRQRTRVIHNGMDWSRFQPTVPNEVLRYLPQGITNYRLVLHPHRPEPSKGLPQTIAVVDALVHEHGLTDIRVLMPKWIESGVGPEVWAFYGQMRDEIAARELTDYFVFHEWIPQRLMHEYYSLGAVTLALGHFVEAFGNVPYESLGCGTPAIVARVATHRELLPDEMMDKVHFGQNGQAAAIAAEIIRTGRRTSAETLAYLQANLGVKAQLDGYADAILNAQQRGDLVYGYTPRTAHTRYRLAPWCYVWSGGVYHDFKAEHADLPELVEVVNGLPEGFTVAEAAQLGISAAVVEGWYREGYVVLAGR